LSYSDKNKPTDITYITRVLYFIPTDCNNSLWVNILKLFVANIDPYGACI